jgi:hypothetical protein
MNTGGFITGMVAGMLFASGVALAGWSDYLDSLKDSVSPDAGTATATTGALSQDEMVAGLREALQQGTRFAVNQLGRKDGFLGDARVRIPMPDSLQWAEKSLRTVGQDRLADEFITTMNRAAEQAVPEAAALFGDAIRSMTLEDARAILNGPDDAATRYFQDRTGPALAEKMLPIVREATASAGVTASYKQMMSRAGGLGGLLGGDTTDLDGYVTGKALDGLFLMVAEEERRIRENPLARGSELLRKVFGGAAP